MIDSQTTFSMDAQELLENLKRQGIYARVERVDHGGHTAETYYDEYGEEIERNAGDLVVTFRLHHGSYPDDKPQQAPKKVKRTDFDAFEAARTVIPDGSGRKQW